ncbi:MAG: hypothetical protein WCO56_03765 [Verrucomicrobiota bacterium]
MAKKLAGKKIGIQFLLQKNQTEENRRLGAGVYGHYYRLFSPPASLETTL